MTIDVCRLEFMLQWYYELLEVSFMASIKGSPEEHMFPLSGMYMRSIASPKGHRKKLDLHKSPRTIDNLFCVIKCLMDVWPKFGPSRIVGAFQGPY